MGKLRCVCGHTIVDQTNNISYKGYLIPDNQIDRVYDNISSSVSELLDSKDSNERMEWIKKNFFVPPYPTDMKDFEMINDLISKHTNEKTQSMFECENCGRIAIEVGQTSTFEFYKPENETVNQILDGNKK
ncbi:hypothetical protein [Aquimarina rubra]|uniref:TFIIS-type domain-containing protein n=1 Tax=Aquimarina rubra TaxID=1920033 RepID=A0ABW5LCP7_9FLAO